jgi:hypothetical protein
MIKSVTTKELNLLLEEWKLRSAKHIFASNKSIDNEEIKRMRAESDAINKCTSELFDLMSGKRE